jgi:hypothetical protein
MHGNRPDRKPTPRCRSAPVSSLSARAQTYRCR